MTTASGKKYLIWFLAGMALAHALVMWELRSHILQGYGDFAAFYTAGACVQRGQAAQMYDPAKQWELQQEFAPNVKLRQGPLPFIRPPFEALLFLPFAYLPYPVACVLWIVCNFALLIAIPFLLQPYVVGEPLLPAAAGGVLAFGLVPVANSLVQGQDAILLTFLVVLSFICARRGADFRSGAILALGLFKFHLLIPVAVVLLLKRSRRFAAGFLAVASILVLVSWALVGWDGLVRYPKFVWHLNQLQSVGVVTPGSMANLRGLTTALLGGAGAQARVAPIFVLLGIGGIVFTCAVWKSDALEPRPITAGFSLSLVVTILTSYYAYGYDMSLLLLPIWTLGGTFLRATDLPPVARRMFVAGVIALSCSPLYWFLALYTRQFYWFAVVILLLLAGALTSMTRKGKATTA